MFIKTPFENQVNAVNETLKVDNKLQLSHQNFIDDIREQLKIRKISLIERLKHIQEFPTTHVLADLSWKVYEDQEKEKLPDGWKLLTTAQNKEISNGYFGAAFLNPESQHCVVSHRGTELSNFGSVLTDITGILFNNYAGQMDSACTFATKVADALKIIESESEDTHFELFFTGHSLGGYLAQITNFSNAFLKQNEETFKRREPNDGEPFHTFAIVFDSPGSLPMLMKMKSKFETSDDPICLEDLSITSFLSAPNQVNTCNEAFGKVFRIFIDTSKMNFMDRNIGYTLTMHSIENIVKFFGSHDEDQVQEVLEWPLREGITGIQELEKFLKYANYRNHYHIRGTIKEASKKIYVRYKTRKFNRTSKPFSVFSRREKMFLEHFRWLKNLAEYASFNEYFDEIKDCEEIFKKLKSFDIIDQDIHFKRSEEIKYFIPLIKIFLKLFPNIVEKARKFLIDPQIRAKIFSFETKIGLKHKKENFLDFKPSTINLVNIFNNQFSQVSIRNGKSYDGLSMIFNELERSSFKNKYSNDGILVLDLQRFTIVNELIDVKEYLKSSQNNFLVIVHCEDNVEIIEDSRNPFKNLIDALNDHPEFKIIMIGGSENLHFNDICEQVKEKIPDGFYKVEKEISWNDLSKDSQKKILKKGINFQGRHETLENFEIENLNDTLMNHILNCEDLEVNVDPFMKNSFTVYTNDHEKKELKGKLLLESLENNEDVLFISGIYNESFEKSSGEMKKILQVDNSNEESLVDHNIVINLERLNECKKKLQITTTVGTDKTLEEFDEKCRNFFDNSNRIVHWIKIKDDKLTWRKSFNNSLYIERKLKTENRVINDKQLHDEENKLIVLVGTNGEGKSATLTHLARGKSKKSWVIHRNFKDIPLDEMKGNELSLDSVATLISKACNYDEENHLQSFLLRQMLSNKTEKPITFFLDNFEDLNDKDRVKAVNLLKFIKDNTSCRVILTLPDNLINLFQELNPSSYTFERMERTDKVKLLKEFWRTQFSLLWGHKKCTEIFSEAKKSKFNSFADILLEHLDSMINKKADEKVMGGPKQLKLLAEGFMEDFEKFVQISTLKQKIIEGLNLKSIYMQYVNAKYELYVTTKAQVASIDQKSKGMWRSFQNISLDSFVPQDFLTKYELCSTDYLIYQLTKNQSAPKLLKTFTGYILTDCKCEKIRKYLNTHEDLLPKCVAFEITDENVQSIVGAPMITACTEGHENILKFLIELLRKKPQLNNVELIEDDSGKNALDYGIEYCHKACVKTLVEFLMDFGNEENLKKSLQNINDNILERFANKAESEEYLEWFSKILIKNNVQKTF
ncbi:CLUMA_CG014684, isoform A [Clunio marinus]|uniref:CLUMA_CG014684, isoform A n=1 Tax=Clunio marinus TaxID=568069 RepID=A0A1J1IMU0_9DIPT|nr:CLUMA_CG014684, isoform A [Clunio marinus]